MTLEFQIYETENKKIKTKLDEKESGGREIRNALMRVSRVRAVIVRQVRLKHDIWVSNMRQRMRKEKLN